MKTNILIIFCILLSGVAEAQNISLRKDTLYSDDEKYALFTKSPEQPYKYSVLGLDGAPLLTIHNGRIEVDGRPGYIITFENDKRQGIIGALPGFPQSVLAELVKSRLVEKGEFINVVAKAEFLNNHPLPAGYTDVDQLIEY